jgi:hypothetical protein
MVGAIIFRNDSEYRISAMANEGSGLESTRTLSRWGLKVETELSRQCARRHIVCSAEGREEVIQR